MERERRPRARRPRGRRLLVWSGVAAALTLAGSAGTVWHRGAFRAAWHGRKMRAARAAGNEEAAEGRLRALAALGRPAARPWLEEMVLRARHRRWRHIAMRALDRDHPGSWVARAMREWEAIRGDPYFADGSRSTWHRKPAGVVRRLERWARRWPRHPGADDAWYVAARHERRAGRGSRAVRRTIRGLAAPDGDCGWMLLRDLPEALARVDDPGELLAAAREDPGAKAWRPLLYYAAGVELLRQRELDRAAGLLRRVAGTPDEAFQELAERFPRLGGRGAAFRARAREQLAFCEDHVQWARRGRGSGADAARALVELGRAYFDRHRVVASFLLRREDFTSVHRDGPAGRRRLELRRSTGYAVARTCFLEALERLPPDAPEREDTEYSAALCLWRLRHTTHLKRVPVGRLLHRPVRDVFRAFAERWPESRKADEALYVAAVHDLFVARQAANSDPGVRPELLRPYLLRILRDHRDGDLVQAIDRYPLLRRAAWWSEEPSRAEQDIEDLVFIYGDPGGSTAEPTEPQTGAVGSAPSPAGAGEAGVSPEGEDGDTGPAEGGRPAVRTFTPLRDTGEDGRDGPLVRTALPEAARPVDASSPDP